MVTPVQDLTFLILALEIVTLNKPQKKILSAYWKLETVWVRFDSTTWGIKIPGNKEIADKMEACSSPLLGSGISKTDYPFCSK